ncbi:MAG: autotransporter-associated beta strand repeat-containing protein [Tepidisphaeraceae bacterium]
MAVAGVVGAGTTAQASTWTPAGGGSWATGANWDTDPTIPNAIGATADFPTPTATRTVTIDSGAGGFLVGAVTFTQDSSNTTIDNTFNIGASGSVLNLDASGSGPATITQNGTGLRKTAFGSRTAFIDDVVANVNQLQSTSSTGPLEWTGIVVTSPGGFTKAGDGLMTWSSNTKAYTGATLVSAGRLRLVNTGRPTATSSFTINGGQLTLTNAGPYILGASAAVPLNLNGSGAASGPFAAFAGAIRNDTDLATTINNDIVIQSSSLIHVEGAASGSTTLAGVISGASGASLRLTAPGASANQGQLVLTNDNTYAGGTLVAGGMLLVSGNGDLGTGNVTVDNSTSSSSTARLRIAADATDAIDDTATLTLLGGGSAGVADQNFADLLYAGTDTIGGLVLGGVPQTLPGTYGSTASGAAHPFDEYFSGPGTVTLVPEPTSLALLGLGSLALVRRRR